MDHAFQAIVLAGGFGQIVRGRSKLIEELFGKPIVQRSVEAVIKAGFRNPVVVINDLFGDQIRAALQGLNCQFFKQTDNIGSAGALAELLTAGQLRSGHIVLCIADLPFVSAGSYRRLVEAHLHTDAAVSLTTYCPATEEEQRFNAYGVIVRDHHNRVLAVAKGQSVLNSLEVDAGPWAIDVGFLAKTMQYVRPDAKLERSVVTFPYLAYQEERYVETVQLDDPHEALGINTAEHLEEARELLRAERALVIA